jgi:hypothetical protein
MNLVIEELVECKNLRKFRRFLCFYLNPVPLQADPKTKLLRLVIDRPFVFVLEQRRWFRFQAIWNCQAASAIKNERPDINIVIQKIALFW